MKSFFFTLDYELFGNGSGNVFKHIIEPTDKLLAVAERFGMRFTIFFEVIEYWKLKEEWEKGNRMGYDRNPVEAMENQIREACRKGHDIQLHLHPQWVDARWEEGKWTVNLEQWRLGGYAGNDENAVAELLERGKQTLEALLKPVDPQYVCMAMRAGGYNIQPSGAIVAAMGATGIFVDTSIYPGGKEMGLLSHYDYTDIDTGKGFWHVGARLEDVGRSEILEVPIVAFPMMRLKKFLTWERVRGVLGNSRLAKDSLEAKTSTAEKKSRVCDKVKYFFGTEWQTWDFCLFSPSLHRLFLKQISKQKRNVFVLVGHPKSYTGSRGLAYLLKKTHKEYGYKTIREEWGKRGISM
ncbi:MAG: hypothetical protein J5871_02485 [Bacteroidales bacterium]|nr:hypothetical protein [Bacteroidales bacterium]